MTASPEQEDIALLLARTLHDLALLQERSGLFEEACALWAEARRILETSEEQHA